MRSLIILSSIIAAATATADTIYKSVDEYGNVRYSDQAPQSEMVLDTIQLEESTIEDEAAQAESKRRIEQMAATSERLQEASNERAENRRQDRELDILARQESEPLIYREPVYTPSYAPGHYGPGYHYPRHGRRDGRFREPIIDLRLGAKKGNANLDLRYNSGGRHHSDYQSRRSEYNGPVIAPKSKLLTPSGMYDKLERRQR